MIAGGGFALSLAMVAAFALGVGGALLIVRQREWKRGLLMIGVGVVLVLNVLIWSWPLPPRQ